MPGQPIKAVIPQTRKYPGTQETPWRSSLTIDLIWAVLNRTLFHPFIAWLVPLCLRAQVTPYSHLSMQLAIAYASLITLWTTLRMVNERVAYGAPREVDLEEEVIVITGGANGLGLLIAEVYGMRGANVAVLDVKELEEPEAKGIACYKCDVGDREQVADALKRVEKDLGTPTILINNAAIMHGKPFLQLTPEDIDRSLRTNLHSHFHTLSLVLPGMLREQRGTIVTVSSVLASFGAAHLTAYTATKAALIALHTSLSAELAPHPYIKTILVAPGQMSTALFDGVESPCNFLAPVVEPTEVVSEIVRLVDGGMGGEVRTPLYARAVGWGWWGLLPAGIQKVARKLSGVDAAMARRASSSLEKSG